MTLYSIAKSNGLVVESGEIQATILPIYEGFIFTNSVYTFPIFNILKEMPVDEL